MIFPGAILRRRSIKPTGNLKTTPSLVVRAIAGWILLLCAAVLNGFFREWLLVPQLGPQVAHVASSLLLSALIFGIGWAMLDWLDVVFRWEAWLMGCIWLLLTVTFEFGSGYFLLHASWSKMLADYDVAHGRIWILVLITTVCTPRCVQRWKD
ncbi:MAG: hypothetical protein ABIZ04_00795 [Opitutus sp.]